MDSSTVTGTLRRIKHAAGAVQRQVQGLPHLNLDSKGRKLKAKLRRQWTMAKHGRQRGSVQCNVLPFMEISVAVQDTLDLVRNSIEEEIVFQATLNVPTHHAIACKIEAFGTPFAAPALHDSPSEWTEDEIQYAACLASPPDLEEMPSFGFTRVASFVEQRAPPLKEASAFATLSFSMRQRQNRQQSADDDHDLPPSEDLARTASSSGRSSLEARRQRTASVQPTIAEEESLTMGEEQPGIRRVLSRVQTRSIARLQSFGPGRQTSHEVEVALPPSGNGVAALLGAGFFVMQQWSEQWTARPGGPLGRNINPWTALLPPGGPNARVVSQGHQGQGRIAGAAPAVAASRVAPMA